MNAFDTKPQDLAPAPAFVDPRPPAAGVRLEGVSAVYDGVRAIEAIDLEIARGEFVALVGPSGAGKTTLLRVIAGLETPSAGRLAIAGNDVTRIPARRRNIGFVFQNYALFGHLSVAENVAFGMRVRPRATRPTRAAIRARVAELLDLVQVGALAGRRPAQLSGGQRQRVALARALATDPALLLLDEPFGALDPVVRKEIRTWLRGLHDRLGLTSILVTHDQQEAIEIADRIVVLRDGRIEQVGSPEALEAAPATDFVHRFLQERVAFDGTLRDGAIMLDDAPGRVLPAPPGLSATRLRLSMRPWEIGLAGAGGIDAVVVEAKRSGGYWRVALELERSGRRIDALLPATGAPPAGRVGLDLSAARIFPLVEDAPRSSPPAPAISGAT